MAQTSGGYLFSVLVLAATLLAGCHDVDLPRGETEIQERSERPPCVPPHIEWPLDRYDHLHIACPPDHPPGFPTPDTSFEGPRITFDHAMQPSQPIPISTNETVEPPAGPDRPTAFHAVDTGYLPIRVTFANTADEILHLVPHQGCARIRAWLDVDGEKLELSDFSERWTCPDVSVRQRIPPVFEHYPVIDEYFTIGPQQMDRLQAGRTYTIYAAFDAENTTWNTTGSIPVTIVDAETLPRIVIDIHDADLLNLTATFHNTSNLTLGYTTHNSCNRWYARILQDGEEIGGGPLPPGQFLCFQAVTRHVIEPGETRAAPYVHDQPLPPGEYEVVVDVGSASTWDASGRARFTVS